MIFGGREDKENSLSYWMSSGSEIVELFLFLLCNNRLFPSLSSWLTRDEQFVAKLSENLANIQQKIEKLIANYWPSLQRVTSFSTRRNFNKGLSASVLPRELANQGRNHVSNFGKQVSHCRPLFSLSVSHPDAVFKPPASASVLKSSKQAIKKGVTSLTRIDVN